MNHIKLIKSKQDHQQASARLMNLMDLDVEHNSPESDELDVLALIIEKYEQETFPIDPVEAIKSRMEQQGLLKKDLIPYVGSAPRVTEILNGTRNLSLNMIRKLHDGLGISLEVLIKEPVNHNAIARHIDWSSFPVSEMYSQGYFDDVGSSLEVLKYNRVENLTTFISSVPNGFEFQRGLLKKSSHSSSNDLKINEYAVWAWQIRVLQKSQNEVLPDNYIARTVNLAWMTKLAKLSLSKQGPLLAKEYLNNHGIHLVIEPNLPKTYLDGAVYLTTSGNPVVALTLKNDKLDEFWFSLMHELAHIALHDDGTEKWFLDNLDPHSGDQIEHQAEALAQEALIPKESWKKGSIKDKPGVRLTSTALEISSCIVANRIRNESGDDRMFGMQFREKVKHFFIE